MKDEPISLETAKLAKEKGFKELVPHRYVDHTRFGKDVQFQGDSCFNQNHNKQEDYYSAPSQSVLQRWLRENHEIHIVIMPCIIPSNETKYYIFKGKLKWDWEDLFNNYEQALEAGLKASLLSINI